MRFFPRLGVRRRAVHAVLAALLLVAGAAPSLPAQAITRAAALDAALRRGPRLAAAAADTSAALAALRAAQALANPTLALSYSKAVPRVHAIVDYPIVDAFLLRGGRSAAATSLREAAGFRFAAARAAILVDVDTTYTRALAADARARLTRRTAVDGAELRRIAQARRDAGDASDLDVRLANVSAGQLANAAAADSLAAVSALIAVQVSMGMSPDSVTIVLADTLGDPPVLAAADPGTAGLGRDPATSGAGAQPPVAPLATDRLLGVVAAQRSLAAAQQSVRVAQLGRYGVPSITAGIEGVDPTQGGERGILPTFGVSIPLPFLSRNGAVVQAAQAERDRATAELAVARLDAAGALARAQRDRAAALVRLERDRALAADADAVAAMALRAYQEGASPLPNVLQARRDARDLLAQTVEDRAAAWNATAALRAASLTIDHPAP
ncbi:MAG TPA: TolC family protein [Gemmatirosa sp.]